MRIITEIQAATASYTAHFERFVNSVLVVSDGSSEGRGKTGNAPAG